MLSPKIPIVVFVWLTTSMVVDARFFRPCPWKPKPGCGGGGGVVPPAPTTPATTPSATRIPATTVPATTIPATTVPATTIPATTIPATTTTTATTLAPQLPLCGDPDDGCVNGVSQGQCVNNVCDNSISGMLVQCYINACADPGPIPRCSCRNAN